MYVSLNSRIGPAGSFTNFHYNLFVILYFTALLIILLFCDAMFVYFSYQSMMARGASVQLVFGFEVNIFNEWANAKVDPGWNMLNGTHVNEGVGDMGH